MRPRKDYDDYTTFVNDTYSDSKVKMFGMLSENNSREGSPKNATFNGANHLSIMRDMKKHTAISTLLHNKLFGFKKFRTSLE